MRPRRSLALLLCASFFLACSEPPTQLVVVVSSSLAIPRALERVTVRTEEGGATIAEHAFPLSASADLPLSFAIVPRGGDSTRSVTVVAEGSSAAGVVARHRVTTGFVRGESRLVRLHLDACGAPPCEVVETLAPESLPVAVPGQELGEADAGRDDADAGAVDAGVEASDAGLVPDAGTPGDPTSCADHRALGATDDGVYSIDPDGDGPLGPLDVFCEMQDDGGGWTLLLKIDGFDPPPSGPSRLGYDATYWTGTETLNPTSLSRAREEAVLESYHALPIRALRLEMWENPAMTTTSVLDGLPGTSLASVIRSGETLTFGDTPSWGRAVGQNLGALDCVVTGINVQMAGAVFVRIGAIGSASASCTPAAGWLGVGARVDAQASCDMPGNTAGGARICGPPGQRRRWSRFAIVFGR